MCRGGVRGEAGRSQGSWSLAVKANAWHRPGLLRPPAGGVPDCLCQEEGYVNDSSCPSLLVTLDLPLLLLPSPEVPPSPRINLQPGLDS